MARAVDLHAHWIPPEVAQQLRRRRAAPRIEERPTAICSLPGRAGAHSCRSAISMTGVYSCGDTASRCRFSRSPDCSASTACRSTSPGRWSTAFNDAAAAACRADPGTSPRSLRCRSPTSCGEPRTRARTCARPARRDPAGGRLRSLAAAERFKPLFAVANRLGSHFFVHPGPLAPQPERTVPAYKRIMRGSGASCSRRRRGCRR